MEHIEFISKIEFFVLILELLTLKKNITMIDEKSLNKESENKLSNSNTTSSNDMDSNFPKLLSENDNESTSSPSYFLSSGGPSSSGPLKFTSEISSNDSVTSNTILEEKSFNINDSSLEKTDSNNFKSPIYNYQSKTEKQPQQYRGSIIVTPKKKSTSDHLHNQDSSQQKNVAERFIEQNKKNSESLKTNTNQMQSEQNSISIILKSDDLEESCQESGEDYQGSFETEMNSNSYLKKIMISNENLHSKDLTDDTKNSSFDGQKYHSFDHFDFNKSENYHNKSNQEQTKSNFLETKDNEHYCSNVISPISDIVHANEKKNLFVSEDSEKQFEKSYSFNSSINDEMTRTEVNASNMDENLELTSKNEQISNLDNTKENKPLTIFPITNTGDQNPINNQIESDFIESFSISSNENISQKKKNDNHLKTDNEFSTSHSERESNFIIDESNKSSALIEIQKKNSSEEKQLSIDRDVNVSSSIAISSIETKINPTQRHMKKFQDETSKTFFADEIQNSSIISLPQSPFLQSKKTQKCKNVQKPESDDSESINNYSSFIKEIQSEESKSKLVSDQEFNEQNNNLSILHSQNNVKKTSEEESDSNSGEKYNEINNLKSNEKNNEDENGDIIISNLHMPSDFSIIDSSDEYEIVEHKSIRSIKVVSKINEGSNLNLKNSILSSRTELHSELNDEISSSSDFIDQSSLQHPSLLYDDELLSNQLPFIENESVSSKHQSSLLMDHQNLNLNINKTNFSKNNSSEQSRKEFNQNYSLREKEKSNKSLPNSLNENSFSSITIKNNLSSVHNPHSIYLLKSKRSNKNQIHNNFSSQASSENTERFNKEKNYQNEIRDSYEKSDFFPNGHDISLEANSKKDNLPIKYSIMLCSAFDIPGKNEYSNQIKQQPPDYVPFIPTVFTKAYSKDTKKKISLVISNELNYHISQNALMDKAQNSKEKPTVSSHNKEIANVGTFEIVDQSNSLTSIKTPKKDLEKQMSQDIKRNSIEEDEIHPSEINVSEILTESHQKPIISLTRSPIFIQKSLAPEPSNKFSSPSRISSSTMKTNSPYKTSQHSYSQDFSSQQFLSPEYIDQSYISILENARHQLDFIKTSMISSRQVRALRESKMDEFSYTPNPFSIN